MKKTNYYINAIRSMGLQAIKNAGQGHPGMTISAAPINYTIFSSAINLSKKNPNWINRDRFVLSAGHGSMSLYPILYFSRLLDLDSIQYFRQTLKGAPGHPENIYSPYIDASTGPLGQGIANAVGMAISESYLRNIYSELEGLIDHYTFVVVGDGDLQEGISYESMSLAGKLQLHKLIVLHDSNKQQLESSVETVNSENLKTRFESMNWNYYKCDNKFPSINRAIKIAQEQTDKPTFIEVSTIIGEGIKGYENSDKAHGFSIIDGQIQEFNEYFDCDFNNWTFDSEIYYHFYKNIIERGEEKYNIWQQKLEEYKIKNPELVNKFLNQINNPTIDLTKIINLDELPKNKATRNVAGWIMEQINKSQEAHKVFVLSPDISKSTNIKFNKELFNNNHTSNMLMVGIREFAMMGIENGISLHGGIKPIGSSFLAFLDYLKPALRLASISEINPLIVFTHDSIAVGSDGPTHQPIEQLAILRTIPNLNVIRPCDEKETFAAFQIAISNNEKTPTAIVLSRQNLNSLEYSSVTKTTNLSGYKIYKTIHNLEIDFTILASGSEVQLAIETAIFLKNEFDINSEVFSIPNLNKYIELNNFKNEFNFKCGLISIEASNDPTWYKLAQMCRTTEYLNISINKYGYSIDGDINYEYLGFNKYNITSQIINKWFSTNNKFVEKIQKMTKQYNTKFNKITGHYE